jgi:hypothetical protein
MLSKLGVFVAFQEVSGFVGGDSLVKIIIHKTNGGGSARGEAFRILD